MDPLTAFAAAQSALSMIRKGVEFYKECKKASADVSDVTNEVAGYIGKFLEAKGTVEESAAKSKRESEDPSNQGNINSQALNNVMMQMQLEQAEVELREMLIYQAPGLNDIWSRFSKERERLTQLKINFQVEEEERKREENRLNGIKARRRKEHLRKMWDELYWAITVLTMIMTFGGCMHLIVADRIKQSPELGVCFIPKGSPGYYWYNNLRWVNCEPKKR